MGGFEVLPAEEPTRRIEGAVQCFAAHWHTATTSWISDAPVRVGLPVDVPTPLMSNVTVVKPFAARRYAMPRRSSWHPPMREYWWTSTKVTGFSVAFEVGRKTRTESVTPGEDSTRVVSIIRPVASKYPLGLMILLLGSTLTEN